MIHYGKIARKIDGRVTSIEVRKQNENDFKNDPNIRLFIISEAAAEGLTLTIASNIFVLEYPWTPSKLDQIIDRVHRMTQLKKVFVHFAIAEQTIYEKIILILDEKRKVIDSVVDGKKTETKMLLTELVKHFKNKK